jgi:nucleoside-diphosphate-sugar epimerase
MSGRVLVTGATGFTGSHLVHALAGDGETVRVIARDATRATAALPPGVEIVTGDVTDASLVNRAMAGVSCVYHLAAAYREAGLPDQRYWDVHVGATRHLLQAAHREGVKRFVHCSTVGVHSHIANPPADESWPHQPADVYQATKSEAEREALAFSKTHGLPLTVARPTAIYGPGDLRLLKLFRLIAKRRFVILGDGEIFYHMVYVDDLVRGLRLLATSPAAPGEVFILGGADYRTLNQLAAMIARIVRAPPPRLKLPAWPFQLAGSACERICKPLGIEPPIYRRRVDFFTKSRAFTIEKARRVLGYEPQVSLEEGLARTAAWYREHGYLPAAAGAA